MQVGTTKDQGLYNKPLAAVHLGVLAAWTLLQYNTIVGKDLKNSSRTRRMTIDWGTYGAK